MAFGVHVDARFAGREPVPGVWQAPGIAHLLGAGFNYLGYTPRRVPGAASERVRGGVMGRQACGSLDPEIESFVCR